MDRQHLPALMAFINVVDHGSFTRAAAAMGTSQPALSHAIKRLEEATNIRLLARTTRNLALTSAGRQLYEQIKPALGTIEHSLERLAESDNQPSGRLRITANASAAQRILLPAVERLVSEYPNIQVDISVDSRLVNIVEEGFDAGVRLGEQIERDMVAIPVSDDVRMAVVGSPGYFQQHGRPSHPHQLPRFPCINIRMPTRGGFYVWELEGEGRPFNVRVQGSFSTNSDALVLEAARRGLGLACLPREMVEDEVASGHLVTVLDEWCPPFPGYHLYYPSRRHHSRAFQLFIDAVRWTP